MLNIPHCEYMTPKRHRNPTESTSNNDRNRCTEKTSKQPNDMSLDRNGGWRAGWGGGIFDLNLFVSSSLVWRARVCCLSGHMRYLLCFKIDQFITVCEKCLLALGCVFYFIFFSFFQLKTIFFSNIHSHNNSSGRSVCESAIVHVREKPHTIFGQTKLCVFPFCTHIIRNHYFDIKFEWCHCFCNRFGNWSEAPKMCWMHVRGGKGGGGGCAEKNINGNTQQQHQQQ